jgi:hypothetical protein
MAFGGLMKRLAFLISVLPFLVVPFVQPLRADTPKECTLCVGAVSDLNAVPATPVPLLVRLRESDLATAGPALDALSPEQRRKTTVIVSYVIDKTLDPLQEVETHTKTIVDWARTRGPFQSFGIALDAPNADVAAYALKRLSVTAQGLNVANKIVEAQAPSPVTDRQATSPNPFFDLAQALANGATRAYLTGPADFPALANLNQMFAGDWAYDSTSQTTVLDAKGNAVAMPVLTFVRGEDLRTIVVPKGDAAPRPSSRCRPIATSAAPHRRRG